MSNKFKEHERLNLSEINKDLLSKWEKENLFQESIDTRKGCPPFVFYEGPPSANGMPGIHHVIARSIKDIFCRYKTMKGFSVNRKAGWDTHGLPVELGVEKSLGITKEDIGKTISIEEYNSHCRKDVMKYTKEWEDLTKKMGYWVDMNDPYITYDNKYIETLWYLLKELFDKGLLYKGYTIQPYSPAAGTGLSSHELNQPGCYRDVKDTTCIAQFKIKNPKADWTNHGTPFFLAWTTTPWTLPSNTALCVGPNIDYVSIDTYNPYNGTPICVIMAEALVSSIFNPEYECKDGLCDYDKESKKLPYKINGHYKGVDLVGIEYEQLIPWIKPLLGGAFKVISGDFVSTEDGTGIVHIAPTFGADDSKVAKNFGVPGLMVIDKSGKERPLVDLRGRFYNIEDMDESFVKDYVDIDLYSQYAGAFVKNAYDDSKTDSDESLDVLICLSLKSLGLVFKIEKHTHNYPHCWRTDKPILYYPLDSWFIKTTAVKDRLISLNKTINWKPESTGTGRFGKWLENLQDWNLSRSRYWGTPLPIWRSIDDDEIKCIGSLKELIEEIEKSVSCGFMSENPFKDFVVGNYSKDNYDKIDLHRPYVDDIVLVSSNGKAMRRETDLIDVWFDSGAMPYAQLHYPFENKDKIDNGDLFPADFIAEGVDQTRGWFFTLHAISTMISDSCSYKAVISNGLVLDKNGNKMSKRLGNAIDPFETIEKYGSDPLRWYLISNSSPWDNIKFDISGVEEVQRKFFGTLFNTYQFFALYANIDGFEPNKSFDVKERLSEIDKWILSSLNTLILNVDEYMNDYEPTKAVRAINDFVCEQLSNWYVRLSRRRFWAGSMTEDKIAAYNTLYKCLLTVSKLMAPVSPFFADSLYRDLTKEEKSVHLADFPAADTSMINRGIEASMQRAQQISSMVLALRRKVSIKVRQPLQTLLLPIISEEERRVIEPVIPLILSEVNIKEFKFVDDSNGILVKKIKPNFKKLGPKFGKIMKELANVISLMTQKDIIDFEKNGFCKLLVNGMEAEINIDDVDIFSEDVSGWVVANDGMLTVAIDTNISDELYKEGLAREIINRIQNLRKINGLDVSDKINVLLSNNEEIKKVLISYGDYISKEIQAETLEMSDDGTLCNNLDIEGLDVFASIEKSNNKK